MNSAPTLCATDTLSANWRMILRGLLAALGAWRIEPVVAFVVYRRISTTFCRIERILARFRAGRLWRRTLGGAGAGRRARGMRRVALPRRFGWLVQAGGHQAASFGLQLQAQLNTPEMAELLATSAQAGRILRPICRALAVELPGIEAKPTTDCGEMTPSRRKPHPTPEPFRIALPRGVLTAARRHGFGKRG